MEFVVGDYASPTIKRKTKSRLTNTVDEKEEEKDENKEEKEEIEEEPAPIIRAFDKEPDLSPPHAVNVPKLVNYIRKIFKEFQNGKYLSQLDKFIKIWGPQTDGECPAAEFIGESIRYGGGVHLYLDPKREAFEV